MQKIWAEKALTPEGWKTDTLVTIAGAGTITAVTPEAPPEGTRVRTLLPAPANVHSHAFQRLMAGLAERRDLATRDDFWSWRELMYRILELLPPEGAEAIATIAQVEMLEAGFAAVGEFHYIHHQPGGVPYDDIAEHSGGVVNAAAATGIGLTLLPVLYQHGGCDRRPLAGPQLRFGNDPDRFSELWLSASEKVKQLPQDASMGVAAHSIRAVAKEGFEYLRQFAPDAPFHAHVAEQQREVEEVRQAYGKSPLDWLLSNLDVDEGWCLIHGTQATGEEIDAMVGRGAVVGLCPITESNLGDGIYRCDRHLEAGGRIAIGSDSNVRISVAEELRTLEYTQRLRDRRRGALASPGRSVGRCLLEHVCAGGAQALGRHSGAIAPGLLADLVAIGSDNPFFEALEEDSQVDAWVFASDNSVVQDVWSAGRHVVQGGRHVRRDAIEQEHRNTIAAIIEKCRDG